MLQTVSRAIAVLRAFEGGTVELGLKDLSVKVGLNKVNALRLARTLVHEGLLVHDPNTRRYALSLGCVPLFRGLLGRNGLREVARVHLEKARETTGESACLMVREGWDRVAIDSSPSRQPVRYVIDIGDRRPVYLGAAGQCLISALPAGEWQALLDHVGAEHAAGRTRLTPAAVQERIDTLRARGWAMGRGEWASEAAGAAAPIRDRAGNVIAAITIAVPITRATDSHMEMCGRIAFASAQAIRADFEKINR
ncbi:IclR family transcriptional regulator [Futiania mangrovi]|uniref:IclR family transcriptional regulator n=1 Tax=Futiania mangrovi TaxID=2959716 RepID=A0A9J6PFC6_9PROT|nr:IclR family transcriptional regulator [Futiania mangrovii]MCP1337166.1 IclR family transcriptional regulator [Futiania mangrovii]